MPTALVLVQNELARDPRVRRQLAWLLEDGWTVDSVGIGPAPAEAVRFHTPMTAPPSWTQTTLGTFILYFVLPRRTRFRLLTASRVDRAVHDRIRSGEYDLIIFNDTHFVPWVKDPAVFGTEARAAHLHLDVHEYFPARIRRNSLWRFATGPYYAWVRGLIADPAFTTRSTVADGIADLYRDELGIERPAIVLNSPPFEPGLSPSPVGERIRLLHHGMASWDRGFAQLVDAMRLLDERFELTFMLTGSQEVIRELGELISDLGDRVRIVPPAAMTEIAAATNPYDAEVMFYRPETTNLRLALPNKLFEAVQARLALIVGESPSMTAIVSKFGNGVVVSGWDAADLAAAIGRLTPADVTRMKDGSDRAARELSAEHEASTFRALISPVNLTGSRPDSGDS